MRCDRLAKAGTNWMSRWQPGFRSGCFTPELFCICQLFGNGMQRYWKKSTSQFLGLLYPRLQVSLASRISKCGGHDG